jgi:uncharacterized protein
MSRIDVPEIPGVPGRFHWIGEPISVDWIDGALTLVAPPRSDWFSDPGGGARVLNAPALVAPLDGSYSLVARVDVTLRDTFDAGALVVHGDDLTWAKLALERSPEGESLIVSVVTRGASDDANSSSIAGSHVWLRISRIDDTFAFHMSSDGSIWRFVRHFTLGKLRDPKVGFEVQSPIGEGCTVRFSEITYSAAKLSNLRDGT